MRYMIAPLDLTTEEFEIYKLLYSKMDFDTFKVKYTVEQLANDSNSKLKITKKSASLIIKKFIKENLLTVYSKGSKGNPTIYEIIKLNEIEKHKSNLKETQKELKGNTKETNNTSNCNDFIDLEKHNGNIKETQKEVKGNTKVNPINDKEKEKDIYMLVIKRLNELADTNFRFNSKKVKTVIDARLKEKYELEDFYKVIENKVNEWKNTNMQIYLRPETLFGNKFEGYLNQNNIKKTELKETYNKFDKKEIDYNPNSEISFSSVEEIQKLFSKIENK